MLFDLIIKISKFNNISTFEYDVNTRFDLLIQS